MLKFYDISFFYGIKVFDKISLLKVAFIAFVSDNFSKKTIQVLNLTKKTP